MGVAVANPYRALPLSALSPHQSGILSEQSGKGIDGDILYMVSGVQDPSYSRYLRTKRVNELTTQCVTQPLNYSTKRVLLKNVSVTKRPEFKCFRTYRLQNAMLAKQMTNVL